LRQAQAFLDAEPVAPEHKMIFSIAPSKIIFTATQDGVSF
jgi:hypothetical protein